MPPNPRKIPYDQANDVLEKFAQRTEELLQADRNKAAAFATNTRDWVKFAAWLCAPLIAALWYLYTKQQNTEVLVDKYRTERQNDIKNLQAQIDRWEPDWKLTHDLRESGRSNKEYFLQKNNYSAPQGKE